MKLLWASNLRIRDSMKLLGGATCPRRTGISQRGHKSDSNHSISQPPTDSKTTPLNHHQSADQPTKNHRRENRKKPKPKQQFHTRRRRRAKEKEQLENSSRCCCRFGSPRTERHYRALLNLKRNWGRRLQRKCRRRWRGRDDREGAQEHRRGKWPAASATVARPRGACALGSIRPSPPPCATCASGGG